MDNIVRQVETLTQQANAQQREIVRVAQRTADFVYDINTDRWESPGEKHNYGIIVAQIARVDARCDDYLDFRHRSFWQRLRWLVTGR